MKLSPPQIVYYFMRRQWQTEPSAVAYRAAKEHVPYLGHDAPVNYDGYCAGYLRQGPCVAM